MKFNWDKFKNEKVAVWCDTEEKAKEFIKECHSHNICWSDDSLDTCWRVEGKFTCYSCGYRSKNKMEHDTENELGYENVRFYSTQDYKIIKWESERMKFKVGDKVVKADGSEWSSGDEYKTITKRWKFNGESRYELSDSNLYWFDYELKLYVEKTQCIEPQECKEPQTEFTFPEVVARIKQGEVYISTKGFKFEAKIDLVDEGLRIRYFKDGVKISRRNTGIVMTYQNRFKLEEPKKRVPIYKVEHQKYGKQYDFTSSQLLYKDIFVICNTKHGKSYGKIVSTEYRELTEIEIKQYKECWRA